MQGDLEDTILAPLRPAAPSLLDVVPALAATGGADTEETIIVRRHGGAPALAAPASAVAATYRFRIGQSVIELDKVAYIGRNPSRPRVLRDGMPRLGRVTSPQQEVSATHLEIRQCGGSVIVSDLRSTNGSTVHVPGMSPRHLRQGESMTVTPGTLVDIGDGILIEILPMQHQ